MSAGGGFTDTATVKAAINYLRGNGTQPGSYTLYNSGGYPSFRGMMTWSINWDAVATCGSVYEYAANFQNIFATPTSTLPSTNSENKISVYPNPTSGQFAISNLQLAKNNKIEIINLLGEIVFSKTITDEKEIINISNYPKGVYFLRIDNFRQKIIKL